MSTLHSYSVVLITACLAFTCPGGARASNSPGPVYVNQRASAPADGKSWGSAFRTVQEGLDHAVEGDVVWVASGTYLENVYVNLPLKAYGGFAGSETELGQRSPTANPTVLDGGKAGPVVTIPAYVPDVTVDGFTILNGNAQYGGGIFAGGPSLHVSGNIITSNSANDGGGGIYTNGASPRIIGNTIAGNGAGSGNPPVSGAGGGIYCGGSDVLIYRNSVTGNSATDVGGGGIKFVASSGRIADNVVAQNTSVMED